MYRREIDELRRETKVLIKEFKKLLEDVRAVGIELKYLESLKDA